MVALTSSNMDEIIKASKQIASVMFTLDAEQIKTHPGLVFLAYKKGRAFLTTARRCEEFNN